MEGPSPRTINELMHFVFEFRGLPWHSMYELSRFSLSIRYIDLLHNKGFD